MPFTPVQSTGVNGILFSGFGGQLPPTKSFKGFEKPGPLGGELHSGGSTEGFTLKSGQGVEVLNVSTRGKYTVVFCKDIFGDVPNAMLTWRWVMKKS